MSAFDIDMPTKDANEFRYHHIEREHGFSDSQVCYKL